MKRIAIFAGAVVLAFSVSIWAQTQSEKPSPGLRKFEVFLGHYTFKGQYKKMFLGPGGNVTGDWTFREILGGFFYQGQFTTKDAEGEKRGIQIIGYDTVNKSFFCHEYDDDGMMYSGVSSVIGDTWTYTGQLDLEGRQYLIRATIIVVPDSATFEVKAEISTTGKMWEPFFEGEYTKVKPALKTK